MSSSSPPTKEEIIKKIRTMVGNSIICSRFAQRMEGTTHQFGINIKSLFTFLESGTESEDFTFSLPLKKEHFYKESKYVIEEIGPDINLFLSLLDNLQKQELILSRKEEIISEEGLEKKVIQKEGYFQPEVSLLMFKSIRITVYKEETIKSYFARGSHTHFEFVEE